jgi:histidinol-phosphate aminotransferase
MQKLINTNIEDLQPYSPGKPIRELERELGIAGAIKLASNENPLGPSPKALAAIKETLGEVHRYPDGGCFYLKQALAPRLGVSPDNLIFGNGSDELLEIICRSFLNPGEQVVYAGCAFLEYELISKAAGADRQQIPLKGFVHDLEAMAKAVTKKTKLIFIANPNNPTGTMVNQKAFDDFMQSLPPYVVVVVDEAYYEYVEQNDFPDSISYMRQGRNIITLRTFSKIYGLASLRIGYGIAKTELIGYMNRVRQPFNVNFLAQVAALGALGDEEHLLRTRELTRRGRQFLCHQFDEMGVEYVPSVANFILLDTKCNGQKIYQAMLQEGVIVRAMDMYGLPSYIRVTVGTEGENRRFLEAFRRALHTTKGCLEKLEF